MIHSFILRVPFFYKLLYSFLKLTDMGFIHIREKIDDTEIYTFIELLKATHSQQKVCKTLGVPKSTYYINLKKQPIKTEARRNDFLKNTC